MTIAEFDIKYGIDSSQFERYNLDNIDDVPREFHELMPYICYYSVSDQDDRDEFIDMLPTHALKELKEQLDLYNPKLLFWLGDQNVIEQIGLSDIYIAISEVTYLSED
jgi:hypothetical protein